METMPRKRTLAERWRDLRPTKTAMFWSWVVVVVLTLVVGFEWGGWVTGKTARSMAEAAGHDAVVARLAPMCVTQATHDPQWAEKAKALKTTESWDRTDYVVKQGWATLPAEQQADPRVAEQCVTLLLQHS
ncbi:MAG TPA: hypothetical protein VNU02_05950 [Candidatus Dormibacteraeota bacterium]|nr:hypothetical protein [Candidatus Dormibacteraeota bacterium]